jgi:hypothetical protein
MNKAVLLISTFLAMCSSAMGSIELYYGTYQGANEPSSTPIGGGIVPEFRKLGRADFAVRVCGIEPFDDGAGKIVMYTVAVAGTFRSGPPKYTCFVTHLNSDWYVSRINVNPVPNTPDRAKGIATILFEPGDYFFVIQVRSKTEADNLKAGFDSLKPGSGSKQGSSTSPPTPDTK